MRRLAHVRLLIMDDFALQPLDATETTRPDCPGSSTRRLNRRDVKVEEP